MANFVINLPQKIYEEYSDKFKGIFIFFDEFQILKDLNKQLDSFSWFLRNSIQDQKNVAYILTGNMSLKDEFIEKIAGNHGAFGGRMITIEIKPFNYNTTKRYLKKKQNN